MKRYKLTDQDIRTYNGYQWHVGEWHEATGSNKDLCSDGWLHCYDSPELAVLLNPIHADIENPRLWEVETKGRSKNDYGLKRGYKHIRLVRELPLPEITSEQRIRFAILCAKTVYDNPSWTEWADEWLSGEDRTEAAARAAAGAAAGAARAAWAAKSIDLVAIAKEALK